MRFTLRMLTLAAGLLGLAGAASAQTKSAFAFTKTAQADVVDSVKDTSNQLDVRPNQSGEFFLYVFNPLKKTATYVVELRGNAGSQSQTSTKATVSVPGEKWRRVRFAKPAAPAAPALQPGAAPAPKAAENPPGTQLAGDNGSYGFTIYLWDADGTTAPTLDGYANSTTASVKILEPSAYVDVSGTKDVVLKGGTCTPVFTLKPKAGALKPPAAVTLHFQANAKEPSTIGNGLYRQTLADKDITLKGSITSKAASQRMYVGVDGVDRAFIYNVVTGTDGTGSLANDGAKATRVYPASGFAASAKTSPVAKYPLRIEADNAAPSDQIVLVIKSKTDAAIKDEIPLGTARDEQVWLDTPGKTDDSVLISTRSRDWVKELDLTPYVGKIEISAELRTAGGGGVQAKVESFELVVDASGPKPGPITIENLTAKNEHVKGKPLSVSATASDDLTDVKKAVFFIGRLTDEKKIPADAVKAEGYTNDPEKKVWKAKLPLPAENPDQVVVSVVFFNEVGLAGDEQTITVKLIEAAGPGGPAGPGVGTITGTVKIGELRQGGVTVVLRSADGKEIATTKTATKDDDKTKTKIGDFKFEKVPVGAYTVLSAKESSSYPYAAVTAAQVKADETTKVSLSMLKVVK